MKYITWFLTFLFSTALFAQNPDSLFRRIQNPKVGVVLSGGGAKGLAHIGVLKVLEQEGVKIDFIGGTSMGAMVGGLYAAGYSANQLDSIFRVIDFDEVIQDNLPRRVKSFFEKENDEKYSVTFPFYKMKFGIPIAFSKGQNTYNLFNQLLYNVRHTDDFNELPIPFVCVATNIETGKQVLLNKGNLAQAIVASGSLPTLFTPAKIDGMYLTDGGIVNNYPVEEIRKLGADIIIGVDVQTNLLNREELNSAAKVVMQIINFQMLQTMSAKVLQTDIYIKPNIKDFNVISFADGDKIVKNGETAADEYRQQFREIAKLQSNIEQRKNVSNEQWLKKITAIEIRGTENYSRAYILGKLRFKTGDVLSFNAFSEGFNRLNATQNFSSISYHFEKYADGDKLVLVLEENKIKTYIRFGLHYDELYKSGLLLNLTHKNVITRNDIVSADLVLGDNVRYNLEYYIDNGFYWTFGFRSKFHQFKSEIPVNFYEYIPEYQGLKNINVSYYDFTNQAYLQTIFKQIFLVGGGLEYKIIDINSETVTIGGQDFNDVYRSSNFLSAYGFLTLDTYDKKYFPRRGIYFDGNFKWILNSNVLGTKLGKYSIAQGSAGYATPLLRRLTLNVTGEAGFTLGHSDGLLDFLLGGYGYTPISNFKHFYGYDFISLEGDSYIKSNIGLDYEFIRKNHFNFYANFANVGDDIFSKTSTSFGKPTYTGYAVGYGMETLIGPIEVKYTWSPEINSSFWWVNVGFWF